MKSKLEAWLEVKKHFDKFYSLRGIARDDYAPILKRAASDYWFIYGSRFYVNKKPGERD